MEQLDLLAYPQAPGWKAEGTSRDAARAVKPRARGLREKVLALLKDFALTADEVAAKLGEEPGTIRPRCTELHTEQPPQIYDTGRRRPNKSGLMAIVWKGFS